MIHIICRLLYDSYTLLPWNALKKLARDDFLAFAFFRNTPQSKAFSFGFFRVTCFFLKCPTFTMQHKLCSKCWKCPIFPSDPESWSMMHKLCIVKVGHFEKNTWPVFKQKTHQNWKLYILAQNFWGISKMQTPSHDKNFYHKILPDMLFMALHDAIP